MQDHRRGVTLPRQTDRYCNEKLRKHRVGTPIVCGTGPSTQSRWHLGAPRGRQKLSVRAAFAIVYIAARANEHLTRLIRRDRAESLVTQSDRLLSAHF